MPILYIMYLKGSQVSFTYFRVIVNALKSSQVNFIQDPLTESLSSDLFQK